jgi:hypothetical protein
MMGGIDGIPGAWAYVEGGMGAVSSAIAKSAMASGATVVTEAVLFLPLFLRVDLFSLSVIFFWTAIRRHAE